MIDYTIVLLALMFGVVSGLLPGVGHLLSIIIISPWLSQWSAVNIFIFYCVLVQVSQFLGSITTIFTRVPGELSSAPMLAELKNITSYRLPEVISSTAVGSFFGMIIAICICLVMLPLLKYSSFFYRTEVMLILLITSFMMIFFTSNGSIINKIIITVIGATLGLIGYNQTLETNILTFGINNLMPGVPSILAAICLFAFPQLYQFKNLKIISKQKKKITINIPWSAIKIMPMASILGFVGGLMPGLATIFSSQIAYAWSKYKTRDGVARITAAETANNAGGISQMIPMLILGLPIVSSEALTLNYMEARGFLPGVDQGLNYIISAIFPLLTTAIVVTLLAWPAVYFTIGLLKTNMILIRNIIIVFLMIVIFYEAHQAAQLMFYTICFLVLLFFGFLLRKSDNLLLLFSFFISERILEYLSRIWILY